MAENQPNPPVAIVADTIAPADPPARGDIATRFTGAVDWDERLDTLQASAGEWFVLRTYSGFQSVGSIMQHLKRKANRRGGTWEFTTRRTENGVDLYGVCHVAPVEPVEAQS